MQPEERGTAPLAGGLLQHGYQCGMIWGATLAAGAEAHRLFGPGARAETMAIIAAQKVVESFRARNKYINCLEITDLGTSASVMKMIKFFLLKGGVVGCFHMAARYAPVAFDAINTALSEQHVEVSAPPVSCAAMLARKMGASDMHATMAAGWAGGIGLCGGACGALGAAIWIIEMSSRKESDGQHGFKNPGAAAVIERFLKGTDCEFECSKIVGRNFANVEDHAGYLRDGGCSNLIEALAAK